MPNSPSDKILKDFFETEINKGFERRFMDNLHEDFNTVLTNFASFAEKLHQEKSNRIYRGTEKNINKSIKDWDINIMTPLIINEIFAVKTQLLKHHTYLLSMAAKTALKEPVDEPRIITS